MEELNFKYIHQMIKSLDVSSKQSIAAFFQNWDDDDDSSKKPPVKKTYFPWDFEAEQELENMPVNKPTNTSCAHQWRCYTGLNERYEFCLKCDQKKENK
jgi:hypothetical protein